MMKKLVPTLLFVLVQYITAYILKNETCIEWMRESWAFAYPAGLHLSIMIGLLAEHAIVQWKSKIKRDIGDDIDSLLIGFGVALAYFAWLIVVLWS